MTRNRIPDHAKLVRTSVQLRPDQIARAKALAEKDNIGYAWIIRDALDIYLRENTCDTCTPSARIEDEVAA